MFYEDNGSAYMVGLITGHAGGYWNDWVRGTTAETLEQEMGGFIS
jgi:hypothetical protein